MLWITNLTVGGGGAERVSADTAVLLTKLWRVLLVGESPVAALEGNYPGCFLPRELAQLQG